MTDEEIKKLLDDPDSALTRWYDGFMTPADPRIKLTGGPTPPPKRIMEIFDTWLSSRRSALREALCGRFNGAALERHERTEIALVTALSVVIATIHLPEQVDPLATATLLVATRSLSRLCVDDDPPVDPG